MGSVDRQAAPEAVAVRQGEGGGELRRIVWLGQDGDPQRVAVGGIELEQQTPQVSLLRHGADRRKHDAVQGFDRHVAVAEQDPHLRPVIEHALGVVLHERDGVRNVDVHLVTHVATGRAARIEGEGGASADQHQADQP